MADNLFNSAHKSATKKSREGYNGTTWETKKPCWLCGFSGCHECGGAAKKSSEQNKK